MPFKVSNLISHVAVKVNFKNFSLIIVLLYILPSLSKKVFNNIIEHLQFQTTLLYFRLLIIGDINVPNFSSYCQSNNFNLLRITNCKAESL